MTNHLLHCTFALDEAKEKAKIYKGGDDEDTDQPTASTQSQGTKCA